MFAYTVRCEFDDPAVAQQWLSWMESEHLADVCAAGALGADVIRLDGDPVSHRPQDAGVCVIEVRYSFASRKAFAAYERDHAPRLRAEGLKRFPPERGLRYTRSTGECVTRYPRPA